MPLRYTSADEDSARWDGFAFRGGDIVVSTRSKHGTTWVQTILLLLIHRQPALPAPLAELSPWLDHLVEPLDTVLARLDVQTRRRVIKTHTPLDGVPLDPRATFVVVARHPLDAAVSLYHQGANIDRVRLARLTGAAGPDDRAASRSDTGSDAAAAAWLSAWIGRSVDAVRSLDSLPGVLRHLTDAWSRRQADNVVLVHYDDLLQGLEAQMSRLAALLDLEAPTAALSRAASLGHMRAHASRFVPDRLGILRDSRAFFRQGRSGAGAALLSEAELEDYHRRTRDLAPADLLAWLHR